MTYESYFVFHLQTSLTHQWFFFWHDLGGMPVIFSYVVFNYYWLWDKYRAEDSPAKHLILFRSVLLKSPVIQSSIIWLLKKDRRTQLSDSSVLISNKNSNKWVLKAHYYAHNFFDLIFSRCIRYIKKKKKSNLMSGKYLLQIKPKTQSFWFLDFL